MKDKANWYIRASRELNDKTFEAAHILRMSKSAFIREAVEEKISRGKKNPKYLMDDGVVVPWPAKPATTEEHFNPAPKSGKKKKGSV